MKILPISNIDGNGQQYIWIYLEEEKVNERGLLSGFKACNIELNHNKQTSTVNEFYYSNGVPRFVRTVKVYKNEIIAPSEVERVLRECGLISTERSKSWPNRLNGEKERKKKIMEKLTIEMKKAGEMAMRNLSKKAYRVYSDSDLAVYRTFDGLFSLRGIIEKDGLSLEEVEKLLETLSDDE